jgi:5'(3')-deoxyribonucleotidase
MMHIAVDMDDVVIDFVGGLITAMKTEHNVTIAPEQITQWDLHPLLDPIIGYSWWTWLQKREWIWATFPPVPGSIGTIERLRSDGHYLELVTNKPQWAEHNVWKWLGKWRPAFNRVTIVDGASSIRKVDVTEASILIDDKPQNCQEFLDQERKAILFRRPHNLTHPTLMTDMEEATNWFDVYKIVSDM